MADQAEVSKSVAYLGTGVNNAAESPKVVCYILLEPGTDESDDTVRRSNVTVYRVAKPVGNY